MDNIELAQSHQEEKKAIFPNIPEAFPESFPPGYRPWVVGWSFSVDKMKEKTNDGTYKLLTLDLSISDAEYVEKVNEGPLNTISERAETEYKCDIGCKHCFECRTDTNNPLMTFEEVKDVVNKAKELGLESVKFLGPGELMHNPQLFEILDFFEQENVKICIFTKGIILGDDELAQKNFGLTAKELCNKITTYNNVRLLVGFTSADPETEHARIGSKIENFSQKRNAGLENIMAAGINKDINLQKLALICAPVMRDNIAEALKIYIWGAKRNIPVILAPTMVSGKGLEMPEVTDPDFKERQLVDLYAAVYQWLIANKIMTLDDIKKEGVSPYAGYACNQFISGMFIRKDGRVQACPGNESFLFRYCDDIRTADMKDVWTRSLGYKKRKKLAEDGTMSLTQPCYAKTEGGGLVETGQGSIAKDFYQDVLAKIETTA
ncbi:MAG: radical SAM protein [Candidatus Komeilibacteria bacterium]